MSTLANKVVAIGCGTGIAHAIDPSRESPRSRLARWRCVGMCTTTGAFCPTCQTQGKVYQTHQLEGTPGWGSLQEQREEILGHVQWCEDWDRKVESWRYSRR